MKILYMLRNQPDDLVHEMIEQHGLEHEVTMVLIQRAAEGPVPPDPPGRMLILAENGQSENRPDNLETIDYAGLLQLIFNNDRVLCI